MSERRDVLREVDWQSLCPWLILVRALRMALTGRVLLLALLGLIAATAGYRIVSDLFYDETSDPAVTQWQDVDSDWPWDNRPSPTATADGKTDAPDARPDLRVTSPWNWRAMAGYATEVRVRVSADGSVTAEDSGRGIPVGGLAAAWEQIARPIGRLFQLGLTWRGVFYALLCGLWSIIVWAMFGGAITRIAALDLTRREQLGFRDAITQTTQRYTSFITAPLLPLVLVAFVAGILVVTGALVRLTVIAWLASVFWFIVLALGLALAALLILLAIGWPLMWATLSVERTDAFDAWSRAYAYAYQRPLRLLFFVLVAAFLGAIGLVVVQVVAGATIWLSDWAVGWGAGNVRMKELDDYPTIQFWKGLVRSVVAAFPIGLLWTSSVAIYLLQRQAIDGAEMDDVALEEQDEPYGLPSLSPHSSGVPEVNAVEDSAPPTRGGDSTESAAEKDAPEAE